MNNNYRIAIQWNQASGTFLAYSPELQDCVADGESFSEAVDNIGLLIEEWMLNAEDYYANQLEESKELLRA